MSDFFLLRGRRSLAREIIAGWVSLTFGVLVFAFFAARFTPSMGQNGAFASALIMSVPLAVMAMQAIRQGQIVLPSLPRRPVGRVLLESEKFEELRKTAEFWRKMDRDELEGLGYLTGVLGFGALPEIGPHVSFADVEKVLIEKVIENRQAGGPDEFFIVVGPKNQTVRVKVDQAKREIHFMMEKS